MADKIDLRGLSCPIPLIRTRDALVSTDSVTVLVDELAPKENILKFAKSQNFSVDCIEAAGEFTLTIRKQS